MGLPLYVCFIKILYNVSHVKSDVSTKICMISMCNEPIDMRCVEYMVLDPSHKL